MTEIRPSVPHTERALYIAHHLPDMETVSVGKFESIAKDIKELGFSKHRFDIRWKTAAPTAHEINDAYLGRAALLAQAGQRKGLDPIVILSTPPKWAYAGKSPEAIREAYVDYATHIKRHFDRVGIPIKAVQILNELNNPIYTPKKLLKEMPSLISATKEVFGDTTDITSTVVLSKPWMNAEKFLTKHQRELSSLSGIGLDFYPGSYQYNRNVITPKGGVTIAHQMLETIATHGTRDARKDFLSLLTDQVTDMSHMKRLLATTKSLFPNTAIDIGEFGFPTLDPLQKRNPNHEALQSYAVKKMAGALSPVIEEYDVRNIGFYELFDDKELGVLNWGLLNDKGEAKNIVKHLPDILASLQKKSPSLT